MTVSESSKRKLKKEQKSKRRQARSKKRAVRYQAKLARYAKESQQEAENPSAVVTFSKRITDGMTHFVSKLLGLESNKSAHRFHLILAFKNWVRYIIHSKLYLLLAATFFILFIPVQYKEALAITGSRWLLNFSDLAFFVHVNVMAWLVNMIVISILMPLIVSMMSNHSIKGNIINAWCIFLIGGYISDLAMCIRLQLAHMKFSVVGCSGGCCVLLGYAVALYIYRFCRSFGHHKKPFYHKTLILLALLMVAECYLDGSSLSRWTINAALLVHEIGFGVGFITFILFWLTAKCIYHKNTVKQS